ncbi:MAG: hypothetical protein ACI8WB_001000 [Phenylobacterium sp.]
MTRPIIAINVISPSEITAVIMLPKLTNTGPQKDPLIEPVRQKKQYQLANLLAQCDPNKPIPETLVQWDSAQLVGNEDSFLRMDET